MGEQPAQPNLSTESHVENVLSVESISKLLGLTLDHHVATELLRCCRRWRIPSPMAATSNIRRAQRCKQPERLSAWAAEAGITGVLEEIVYADPSQAEEFVGRTGVDALAVAVGTSHGSVKFTDESGGQRLRINLIAEIKNRLPHTALVLHGSSSIPVDAVEAINRQGGSVTPSYGIDAAQKRAGIAQGIRKINQGTDSHLAWTAALRTALGDRPSEVEPSPAITAAMAAMTGIVRERMREFGSAGQTYQGPQV